MCKLKKKNCICLEKCAKNNNKQNKNCLPGSEGTVQCTVYSVQCTVCSVYVISKNSLFQDVNPQITTVSNFTL